MNFRQGQATVDLTGKWAFCHSTEGRDFTSMQEAKDTGLKVHPATVPGNFELDLLALGKLDEAYYAKNVFELTKLEDQHVYYGTTFTADAADNDAFLVFEGLDCYADIFLNGKLLGSTDNMLIEHRFDVTNRLQSQNELFVHIKPAVEEAKKYPYPAGVGAMALNYESLYVRKAPHMFGWDIMPRIISAGIWRPVRLQLLPKERLEECYLETIHLAADRSQASLALAFRTLLNDLAANRYEIEITGTCGESSFSKKSPLRFSAGRMTFDVDRPELWWPRGYGEANLYNVSVTLLKNGDAIDGYTFRHGIRTASLTYTETTDAQGSGDFCFIVNGERVFAKGTNWVPTDAFHSRDAERIPAMLDLAVEENCNIIRCWGGNVYENNSFFDLCDEHGIMIWQDFGMACAVYPQDEDFQRRLAEEATAVVKRLRQHACICLWAGDNECDWAYSWHARGNPNKNALTRKVLPDVLKQHDPLRSFLPSSPYISQKAYEAGDQSMPEYHLWGPRNYYKSDFYLKSNCHFVSEIGYHGCPAEESLRQFLSPEKVWPYQNNDEWNLHSTSPSPEADILPSPDYRVNLMPQQIRALFGDVPADLQDFIFASQVTQAEANKFFIELFRGNKWRRSGIIWWNLIDGWPQFSDAVVDYYFEKKLSFHFNKASQQNVCLMMREPQGDKQQLVAVNDTLQPCELRYTVTDVETEEIVCQGTATAEANAATAFATVDYASDQHRFYLIRWESDNGAGANHYMAGEPLFDLNWYKNCLKKTELYPL